MKLFTYCFFLFILIFFKPFAGFSATTVSVSKLNEDDSVKIFKLLEEARMYASQRDYEKAVEAALKAATISENDNFEYGKYRSYLSLEILYRDAGKLIISAKYKLKALKSQSRLEAINYERDERERIEKLEKERRIREQQRQLEKEQEELQQKKEEIERLEREKKLSKGELDKRKYEIARRQIEIDNKKQTIDIQRETINSTFSQLSLTLEELEAQRLRAKIFDDSLKLVRRNEEVLKMSDEKQKLINYLYLVGLSGFIILAAFIYRMYSVKSGMQEILLNKNKEIEEEKKKIDDLLLNILPLRVADELKRTGKYEPRNFEKATILVLSLKRIANNESPATPARYVEELDMLYKAFDDITESNNLERIRAIGDTYICVSGIPVEADHSTMNVIRAAIDMLAFVSNLELERKMQQQGYFEAMAGIHLGPLTAGIIGSKFTFDIWGDTANTATEIRTSGASGKIILTESAFNDIRDKVECNPAGSLSLNNTGAVELYTLGNIKEA